MNVHRQSFLGVDSDRVLSEVNIAVIGLGGGGSHIIQQLAHLGVRRFMLVDPDTYDETNGNRLIGARATDVVLLPPKIDIGRRTILSINPNADIRAYQSTWQEVSSDLMGCDVIVGCVDSVRARDELDRFARRFLIPYIDIGMDVHETGSGFLIAGQVAVSITGGPCLRCMGIVTDAQIEVEDRQYGAAGGRPQVVWPNGVLASIAVGQAIQLVTPWHKSGRVVPLLEYDGNTQSVSPSARLAHVAKGCRHNLDESLGDPGFDIRKALQGPRVADAKPSWFARILDFITRQRWWAGRVNQ
ncbi:MAG: ThiF family adenylyltransferase [Gammaproteobacteria bacterium]|nr:ThiF family adenylyltransferase [Gammaproteobacteria bacterium]MCP5136370.1 ThiF family adenylyltransferase [Gammaproteobacteria bacterium]